MNDELIKIIALDLDGTLLNNDGKIVTENLEALQKVRQERPDIIIVIATGSGINRAMKQIKEHQINEKNNYLICYNGGAIINNSETKTKIIAKRPISISQCQTIFAAATEYSAVELEIYDLDHQRILGWEKIKKIYQQKLHQNQIDINQDFIYKGLIMFPFEEIKIKNIMNEITKKYPDFQFSSSKLSQSHPYYQINPNGIGIEVNSKDTNKGQALATLCEILNIKPEQVMACGDEMNDKSMLEFANYSVAMKNANPALKEIAKFETDSNENAGVAKAINRFVFSQSNQQLCNATNCFESAENLLWEEFQAIVDNSETLFTNCPYKPLIAESLEQLTISHNQNIY